MTNNTMTDTTSIERAVMSRVRTVHAVRPLLSGAMLALALVSLSLWGIGREVWVAKVLENAPHQSLAAAGHFLIVAFLNTRFAVQALIALTLAATVWLARETARLITQAVPAKAY